MKKIKVPEGMIDAADNTLVPRKSKETILEAALEWLADNPIIPSDLEAAKLMQDAYDIGWKRPFSGLDYVTFYAAEWQKRMFLEPEYMIGSETIGQFCVRHQTIETAVKEAYELGRKSK